MWVRVDDGFVEHPKVVAAARHLGTEEVGRIVAVWLEALSYAARNLTDGLVPILIARKFITDKRPLDVLDAMAMPDVRLLIKSPLGYRFHNYDRYQPSASSVKEKRQRDRDRKLPNGSGGNRHGIHAESPWNRDGIVAESERIPTRSRARDPVLIPEKKDQDQDQEQCADAHAVLVKLAFAVLDDISRDADLPPISELAHQLGDLAAQHRIAYVTARQLTKAMDSALALRQRRAS